MKTNYFSVSTGLVALAFMLVFLSCEKDNDDPILMSDTIYVIDTSGYGLLGNLSAVWTLESGYSELFFSRDTRFQWLDDECEDAFDGNFNPLPQEFNNKRVFSKTFNYEDMLATYNQILTTTEENLIDTAYNLPIPKNEYEDAYSKNNVVINFKYDLTLKKNGEYKIYIMFNYFDPDVPSYSDDNSELQFGKTYSGTFEFVSEWRWIENSIGLREGIQFDGFPLPVVNIMPVYDFSDPGYIRFEYNYVTGIDFSMKDRFFEVEKLTSTELVLLTSDHENYDYQNQISEFEAYLIGGFQIDCEGTYTETNVTNENIYFKFVSDGVDVAE